MDTLRPEPRRSSRSTAPIAHFTLLLVAASLLLLCVVAGGCLDLSPPTRGGPLVTPDGGVAEPTAFVVRQASMGLPGAPPRDGLGPASPLWVELSWPVDPSTVSGDTVVLVAGTGESVVEAFLADLDHPPLSASHRARRIEAEVIPELDGGLHRLQIRPRAPLQPSQDYLVALSAALRSIDGRQLVRPDGTPGGVTIGFRTGPAGSGPPWLSLVSPPAGQTEVPVNLARVLVVASEPVTQLPFGLHLVDEHGDAVEGNAEAAGGCPGVGEGVAGAAALDRSAGRCFALVLAAPLRPGRTYVPAARPGVTDHDGEPLVAPLTDEWFRSGDRADLQAPKLAVTRVIARDSDLVIVADSDELATLEVTAIPELETDNESREAARHGQAGPARQLQLVLTGLVPDRVHHLSLTLTDGAGNVTGSELETRTLPELPRVAITEVLADAASSPEPAGEFVELYNHGSVPVDLTGWTLSDNPEGEGASPLAGTLPPGGFALVVSEHYAGPLAGSSLVIPVGGDVARRGLSNSGEPLVLVDATGQTISTFGNPMTPREGVSLERLRPEAPDVPSSWVPSAPGHATPGGPAAGW